ncbi:MAG TPA: hypothetical protein VF228_18075 [Iamia sp.]
MTTRLIALIALLAGLAACGGTRFVVIENGGGAVAATPTTVAAEVASEEDETAIREVVAATLTLEDVPFEERSAHVIGGEDLEPTVDATLEITSGLDVELDITEVTIAGTTATATTDVVVDGEAFATDLPVTLEQVDGEWKITRAGACTILALASPCPEAPAG